MLSIKAIWLLGIVVMSVIPTILAQQRQFENTLHNASPAIESETPKGIAPKAFADKFRFEIVGGPSMCFFTRGELPDQVPFYRYTLALATSYPLSKSLDVEAKILWEPKGALREYWGSDYGLEHLLYKQGFKLDYLTLALTVDYYVDCDRRLYVGGGASLGWLTRQWNFTDRYDTEGNHVDAYKAKEYTFRKFEAGLVANIGYRRPVWKKTLINIQLIGNFGITDVLKKFTPDPYPYPYSNANLALLLGIGVGR
jgi:hypothetical protein